MFAPYSTPESQRPGVATDTPLQRALREQQTLLDSAGVGIVFLRQRSVVRCNERYAEIFGHANPESLVGLNTETFYPSREAFRDLGRTAYPVLAQGQAFRVERQLRRRDGSLFWGSLTGRLINPHDTAEGSIWILDDIDEQKRAQAALGAAVREKLGSAFQKINFLRGLNADFNGKGSRYFPGVVLTNFNEATKSHIEEDIARDFHAGYEGIKQLPRSARFGVYVAYLYYMELFEKIKNTPSHIIPTNRIRVRNRRKLTILAYSYLKHQLNLL